jgi:branched-chain amino acid transport system permease protein
MALILELCMIGIASGSIYAIGAMGFVLIYKSSGIFNFAMGEMMMIGAYFLYTGMVIFGLSLYAALPLALLASALLAAGMERWLLRPLLGQPHEVMIMVLFGAGAMLRGIAGMVWGHDILRLPEILPRKPVFIGDILIPGTLFWGFLMMIAIFGGFIVYYRFSRTGVAIRATADDQTTAECMGINIRGMFLFTWVMAGLLATAAGIVGASVNGLSPYLGNVALEVIAVVLLAGLTSIGGTLLAGAIVGVMLTLIGFYLGGAFQQFMPYLLVLLVMIVRPRGLFGTKLVERI